MNMEQKNITRLTDGVGRRLILGNQYATELFDKLHDLEDIEEKLDIDLTTLFKALFNNKFYALNPYGFDTQVKIIECHGISFEKSEYKGYAIAGYFSLPSESFNHCSWSIKDYGKTWALTSEELKNEA